MTQLITSEPKGLVTYDGSLPSDGNEDVPPAFPIVSIVQPMSQIPKAVPGWFYHSDREEQTAEFDGVLLYRKDTRAMFVDGDDRPVCRSNDGKVPARNQRLWTMERFRLNGSDHAVPPVAPSSCANCIFSDWGDGAPPVCGNAYAIIAARNGDPEDLVQLRLKGTSIKPFRQWVSKTLAPHGLRMYQHQVHLETEEKTVPSRKWHQLVVSSQAIEDMDLVLTYAEILGQHQDRIAEAIADDLPFE